MSDMNMKGEQWFEWERQATVHPLAICMEAWMEPTRKEYGRPWPTCILVYKEDVVCWHLKWPELLDYGDYLIKKFIEPKDRESLLQNIESQAVEMKSLFEEFSSLDFTSLSDNELLEAYNKIHDVFVQWFVPGALVEPIGYQGEKIIQKMISASGKSEKEQAEMLALLTTTTNESFSKRELKDMLLIAVEKKDGKDVGNLLKEHATKYFWLHNNYYSTEVLDEKFFERELELAISKYPNPKAQIEELKTKNLETADRKDELVKELNPDKFHLNLIELMDMFAWYQDYRKKKVMQILHYLDLLLEEIGRRKGHSLKEMKYTLPQEIPKIFNGSFDIGIAKERMKRYLFYFDGKDKVEEGVGSWSIDKENNIFSISSHEGEILEIKGMIANKGYVKGKARVTMSAKDAKDIETGEILITSMTSPDFVTAIKRAAAIVTNEGGVLCHAAVVSREFGIPCIVGTKLATKVFKTGDIIEVDGEFGFVRKVKD